MAQTHSLKSSLLNQIIDKILHIVTFYVALSMKQNRYTNYKLQGKIYNNKIILCYFTQTPLTQLSYN